MWGWGVGVGVLIRVWARRGESAAGQFALDVCSGALTHYETYYGIRFPLPKLDLVAIPEYVWVAVVGFFLEGLGQASS